MKKPLLFGIILTACVVIVAFVFSLGYPGGMISYWKFEGSGATAFDSVDENHGTLVNSPVWTAGKVGGALSFDGVNDYVDVVDDPSLNFGVATDLSLEAWIKTADATALHYPIIEKRESWSPYKGYLLYIRGSVFPDYLGQLVFQLNDAGGYTNYYSTSPDLRDGEWHHVVVSVDRDDPQGIKFYVDGTPYETGNPTSTGNVDSAANLFIGHEVLFRDNYAFPGIIDEVAIYNRALSAGEIQQHYLNGSYEVECVPAPDNMVSWWDGDGNADDIVGGNTGTLEGGATFDTGKVGDAFSFDGTNDYVEIPDSDSLDTGTQFTVDAWFNTDDVDKIDPNGSKTQTIVMYGWDPADGKNNPLHIRDGKLYVAIRGYGTGFDDLVGVTSVNSNTWYHAAVTNNGTTAKLYLNGELEDSKPSSMNMNTNSRVTIGRYQNPANKRTFFHFDGLIDEVEIFNRALDASEIQAIYLAGSAGKCKTTNQPPVAVCENIEIPADENCEAYIILEDIEDIGGGSYDPDEGDTIELSVNNLGPYGFGVHSVILTVTDDSGEFDTCQATVNVIDTTPPNIEFSASPNVLRPPNHKMVQVTLNISSYDNCDEAPNSKIIAVSSNEPENGLGDGDKAPDWDITGDLTLNLRAERSGIGDGRVYTITVRCTDNSGNFSNRQITVTVPHDKKKK